MKSIYVLAIVFLLLGILFACSNSVSEPGVLYDNQTQKENNDDRSDGHYKENLSDDDDSNENRSELAVEENRDEGSNDALDDLNSDETNNTSVDTNTNADDPRALTIGMFSMGPNSRDKTGFREVYTRAFEWEHPNVDIEFTSVTDVIFNQQFTIDTTAELKKLITGDNPPDVLFLSYNDYLALMEDDLFVPLNPFFVDSELSLDDFEPIVADGLVNPQDGQTYGLSPYFKANALIYNKDLFDEMKVPYPRDHMTWEEVFTLAKQMTFHSEDRNVYGLAFDISNYREPMLFDLWIRYIHSLEVQIYDKETGKAAVNNNTWASALTSIKDLYDAGVFPTLTPDSEEDESDLSEEDKLDPLERDRLLGRNKFYSNTIAMGVVEYHDVRRIIDETIAGHISIPNWDVVSIPVHSGLPHIGTGVVMEPVLAINANGRNQLDAWRLVESIHSPEWAGINEEKYITNLSSRKDHAVNLAELDYNKAAFYQLKPANYFESRSYHFGLTNPYIDLITRGGDGYFQFLSGEIEVQEALAQWEFNINNYEARTIVDWANFQ